MTGSPPSEAVPTSIRLSLVIPAKDENDPKLKELLSSIRRQDFPAQEMETLVITEGTSESAKAIGIKKAKGDVIGILASDNELLEKGTLDRAYWLCRHGTEAVYPGWYHISPNDNILNRYFSLMGGNDVLSFYMGKNDRWNFLSGIKWSKPGTSIGDNGFFIKKELIEKTDLNNYYHVDNALEATKNGKLAGPFNYSIWHKTGGNIFSFFKKRYRYGLQHAFNPNRRWHLVERTPRDIWKLFLFVFFSLTLVQPLCLSVRGYLKLRDKAWFMHPVVSLGTVFTYGILVCHLLGRSLIRSLSAPMAARRA